MASFTPGWYQTSPSGQTFQYFQSPTQVTAQGHFEGGKQILDWGPNEKPGGLANEWSSNYKQLDSAKKGDWWDNPISNQTKPAPGGATSSHMPKEEKKEGNKAQQATPTPAPFKGNKTTGQLYTELAPRPASEPTFGEKFDAGVDEAGKFLDAYKDQGAELARQVNDFYGGHPANIAGFATGPLAQQVNEFYGRHPEMILGFIEEKLSDAVSMVTGTEGATLDQVAANINDQIDQQAAAAGGHRGILAGAALASAAMTFFPEKFREVIPWSKGLKLAKKALPDGIDKALDGMRHAPNSTLSDVAKKEAAATEGTVRRSDATGKGGSADQTEGKGQPKEEDKPPASPRSDAGVVVTRGRFKYTLDEKGRVVKVEGELAKNPDQTRNINAQRNAGGADRLPTDDGGHFAGRRFDGPTDDMNHFAQDRNFNRSAYAKLENEWGRLLDSGKTVDIKIIATYPGASLRPDTITAFYSVDKGPWIGQCFQNLVGAPGC